MADRDNSGWGVFELSLFSLFVFALFGVIGWYLFDSRIVYVFAKWKLAESWLLSWVPWIQELRVQFSYAARIPDEVSFGTLVRYIYPLSFAFTVPFIAYFIYVGLKQLKHPTVIARRRFKVDELMLVAARNNTGVLPIQKAGLQTSKDPRWAPRLDPYEFAVNNMLFIVKQVARGGRIKQLNEAKSNEIFLAQLGKTHDFNPKSWEPEEKVMFAIFCEAAFEMGKNNSIGLRRTEGWTNSRKLRDSLNHSAHRKDSKADYSLANPLYKKWIGLMHTHPTLKKLMEHHRYTKTLLFALMTETTDDGFFDGVTRGVLTTAEFLWLRPWNRTLFYVLNAVGRKTPCVESAAVWAQYWAERKALDKGYILQQPVVEYATEGLKRDLIEIGELDDDVQKEKLLGSN